MLGTTSHHNNPPARQLASMVLDHQVSAGSNLTNINNHTTNNNNNQSNHFQSLPPPPPTTSTPKQPPPPSKPPPPPPPPPRSNCSQQSNNSLLSSSVTSSQHSFSANQVLTSNNNPLLAGNSSIANNGLQTNNITNNSNTMNNNNNIPNLSRNKYLTMTTNPNRHGAPNLSPGSSMSSHSSFSILSYARSSGCGSTHCNCHNASTNSSRSNVSMTLGRNVHNEVRPACNHHLQDSHCNHIRAYQPKCNSLNHPSETPSSMLSNHIYPPSNNHICNIHNHVCSPMGIDHLVSSFGMNSNCVNGSNCMQHDINNDINRCQSMMGSINSQPQIFQASPATVCFCSPNVSSSSNDASVGPIVENNGHCRNVGTLKNCTNTHPHKKILASHMHNYSDSSSSTTTNASNIHHHHHHHHNLGCIKNNKSIGSINSQIDTYGPSSAASTSSANTSSFSLNNDIPPPYPLSRFNQPLPPLPLQPKSTQPLPPIPNQSLRSLPTQPPPPPPSQPPPLPPPKTIAQSLQGRNSPISVNSHLAHQQQSVKPSMILKQPQIPSNTLRTQVYTNSLRKSDIPPPLPPPNPGSKMAASGLIPTTLSEGSYAKTPSPSRPSARSTTSSVLLTNLLNHDTTQPKPRGPHETELRSDALTKNSENDSEHKQKNGEPLGNCAYCGEKIAKDYCCAMGKIFHMNCFVCCTCKKTLSGKSFYEVQDKVYCEEDYKKPLQKPSESCAACNQPIIDMILHTMGKSYHPNCFTCCICGGCLDGVPFTMDMNNRIYCVDDYHRQFAPICAACGQPITPIDGTETVRVVSMDKDYHVDCYCCENCKIQLTDEESKRCYPLNDHLLCRKCHIAELSARIEKI